MAIDKRGTTKTQMAALDSEWSRLEGDFNRFMTEATAALYSQESTESGLAQMETVGGRKPRSFTDLLEENKQLLERRTALVNSEKLLESQRVNEAKNSGEQVDQIRKDYRNRKHDSMKKYLKDTKKRIEPTIRELAGERIEKVKADLRSVAASQHWQTAKDTVKSIPGAISGGLTKGWQGVKRAASACCTAISKVFFAAKDALGAWNEARKARNEALKNAATARRESYETIRQTAFDNFTKAAMDLGATVEKNKSGQTVVKKFRLFEKGFIETVRSAWSDPKKFFADVQARRNLQKSLDHTYKSYKEIRLSEKYKKKAEIESKYDEAVERAKETAKEVGEEYKTRVRAERERSKLEKGDDHQPDVEPGHHPV